MVVMMAVIMVVVMGFWIYWFIDRSIYSLSIEGEENCVDPVCVLTWRL